MAAYNYGEYIAQAIDSVVSQTYGDWELVVIDDGSTDQTREIVTKYLIDARIRYHPQRNFGQPCAKNVGIRLSRGQLIAFLDADDAWQPEKLDKQLALFDEDPELGVAYTGAVTMSERGVIIEEQTRQMCRGYVLEFALGRTIPPFSSSIVRREVFDDVGGFDESIPLAIDYDLWLRVAAKYRFDYVDEPLLLYRTGHANLSQREKERREIVLNVIIPRFLDEHGGRARVSRRAIAEAYADTYVNMAKSERRTSFKRAVIWNCRAVIRAPWMPRSWKGLLRTCTPVSLIRFAKATNACKCPTIPIGRGE